MGEDNRSETMPNLAKRESSWGFELTRSNSEVSSLTSEYFKDVLHQSVNVRPVILLFQLFVFYFVDMNVYLLSFGLSLVF